MCLRLVDNTNQEKFSSLLQHLATPHIQTKKWQFSRIISNYLMWRWFARSVLPYLPNPYATSFYEFQSSLGRKINILKLLKLSCNMILMFICPELQVPQLRWHGCVKLTNSLLQDATGAMYVRHYFDEKSKKHVRIF